MIYLGVVLGVLASILCALIGAAIIFLISRNSTPLNKQLPAAPFFKGKPQKRKPKVRGDAEAVEVEAKKL